MEYSGIIMTPAETEIVVRQLRTFNLSEIGTPAWKDQRHAMDLLNMCTHSNAVRKVDDFVKAFLIDHDKLTVVLHELLVMEVWRQRVLPQIFDITAGSLVGEYMYAGYESLLVNLLECICFYEEVVVGFGDDVLELIDYCWRQITRLFSEKDLTGTSKKGSELKTSDPLAAAHQLQREQRIERAMSSLCILWFIIDHLDQLPLAAMNSILRKHDVPMGVAEVLLLQPWLKRTAEGTFKYNMGSYAPADGNEVLRVCVPEAHAWFSINKLLCDPEFRRQYPYTQHKKANLLRLRSLLNETLIDQIPVLQSVQRALEELSFMEPPTGTEEKFKSTLVIEQVPRLMSEIDKSTEDWRARAQDMRRHLTDPREQQEDVRRMSQFVNAILEKDS